MTRLTFPRTWIVSLTVCDSPAAQSEDEHARQEYAQQQRGMRGAERQDGQPSQQPRHAHDHAELQDERLDAMGAFGLGNQKGLRAQEDEREDRRNQRQHHSASAQVVEQRRQDRLKRDEREPEAEHGAVADVAQRVSAGQCVSVHRAGIAAG
jgi:hypothetical protein